MVIKHKISTLGDSAKNAFSTPENFDQSESDQKTLTRDAGHSDGVLVGELVMLNVLGRDDDRRHPAEVRRRLGPTDLTLLLRRRQ